MANYRDAAMAAYSGRRTDWIKKGQARLVPLMTDATGKAVLDPYTKTRVDAEDLAEDLLVLSTTDGSLVSFAVWPNHPDRVVRVTKLHDGQWTLGPEVKDLDDVGAALLEIGA